MKELYFIKPKVVIFIVFTVLFSVLNSYGQRQMEKLNRGLVAVKKDNGVYIGWRIFADEYSNVSFEKFFAGGFF